MNKPMQTQSRRYGAAQFRRLFAPILFLAVGAGCTSTVQVQRDASDTDAEGAAKPNDSLEAPEDSVGNDELQRHLYSQFGGLIRRARKDC